MVLGETGVEITRDPGGGSLSGKVLEPVLAQWADAGYAVEDVSVWRMPWDAVYALREDEDYRVVSESGGVPGVITLAPRLVSRGSLTDRNFSVALSGWVDAGGRSVDGVQLTGAIAATPGHIRGKGMLVGLFRRAP